MVETATQISMGAIVSLLILREVFAYLLKRKDHDTAKLSTDRTKEIMAQLENIIARLDRVIERLDDLSVATKQARRQTEIAAEQTERMVRAVSQFEKTFNGAGLHRRTQDTPAGA